MAKSPERQETYKVVYLGRLSDFELGNPEGIASSLESPEEIEAYGREVGECIRPITDAQHVGCIDGRFCIGNADGSEPQVRARVVSGTGSASETAILGGSPIMDTIDPSTPQVEVMKKLDAHLEATLHIKPSSHTATCGGEKGMPEDAEAIADTADPRVARASEALMDQEDVKRSTGIGFDRGLLGGIAENAGAQAMRLRAEGWQADTYVNSVKAREPQGVEVLDAGAPGAPHHGHAEPGIFIVLDKGVSVSEAELKARGLKSPFVWNMQTSLEFAEAFGGARGEQGVTQAFMANVLKHIATSARLAAPNIPIYVSYGLTTG